MPTAPGRGSFPLSFLDSSCFFSAAPYPTAVYIAALYITVVNTAAPIQPVCFVKPGGAAVRAYRVTTTAVTAAVTAARALAKIACRQ
jgi:hypothetical protein